MQLLTYYILTAYAIMLHFRHVFSRKLIVMCGLI